MTRIRFDGLADASQPDASAGHPIEIAGKYLSPRRRSFKGIRPTLPGSKKTGLGA
jgi:hypothetical protein